MFHLLAGGWCITVLYCLVFSWQHKKCESNKYGLTFTINTGPLYHELLHYFFTTNIGQQKNNYINNISYLQECLYWCKGCFMVWETCFQYLCLNLLLRCMYIGIYMVSFAPTISGVHVTWYQFTVVRKNSDKQRNITCFILACNLLNQIHEIQVINHGILVILWNEAQMALWSVKYVSKTPAWISKWAMFVNMCSIKVLLSVV